MEQSESINELAKALSTAQAEKLFALKDSKNPFFNSKYADLSSVWEVAREPLTNNGLSVAQTMDIYQDGSPIIVTTLMHTSGQWIKSRLHVKPEKDTPQGLGSAITYGRRYSLAAMIGICPEDDDAEGAMSRDKKSTKKSAPKSRPAPQQSAPATTPHATATQAQTRKIFALGKEKQLTSDETAKVARWHRKGEKMTKAEASALIENFDKRFDEYLESIEKQNL